MAITYLIKVGTFTIPLQLMKLESYKAAPNQIQDLDSYRDADGVLHRSALTHTATKVEFETPYLYVPDMEYLIQNIRANLLTLTEYDCNLTYFNVETNDYKTGHFYMPGTREYQLYNKEIFAPSKFAFIEY